MNYSDTQFFLFINQHHNNALDFLTVAMSWITEGALLWIVIFFIFLLLNKTDNKRKIILFFANLTLSSWIINVPFKMLFFRDRPYEAIEGARVLGRLWTNSSFPSGHMASSIAALVIIAYLFKIPLKWIIILSTLILFLGFARIYTGMHYFSDVIGGILVGLFSSALIIWLDKQITFLNNKNI
ncbi:MAG: phosphatase PAP2 family protein [bacterium]